jgi:lysophospholipase L1-like esterase/glucose/arabinose dehydrogenase/azurin
MSETKMMTQQSTHMRPMGRLLLGLLVSTLAVAAVTLGIAGHRNAAAAPAPSPDQPFTLNKGDHIALLGGALPDRMQHDGYLEALIYSRFPQNDLVFRNLSAAGDEVGTWHRSENFGTRDQWLARTQADVIFAFYGFNESFQGDAGLPQFKSDLQKFIEDSAKQNYSGKGAPRVVLFSPIAVEHNRDPNIPDITAANANIEKYTAAMAEVAKATNTPFVDLFHTSKGLYEQAAAEKKSLTINGMHLTAEGNRLLAPEIFRGIFKESAPAGDNEKLRAAIVDKDEMWHSRYRTMDGYNIYGGRSAEAYQPEKGSYITNRNPPAPYVSNYQVMQQEMSQRDVMTANRDKHIWGVAEGKDVPVVDDDLPPVEKVKTNHPGPNPDESWPYLSGEEAISKMKVPEHCKVNLFASEEMFDHELIKPLQMLWDTKGRLWVSVWRNYPERTPTSKVGDSILILEDTKGTGRADKVTHYIDNLNCPTGFQFYKDGILLMQAPDLLYVHDSKGGDHADTIERVVMGMDSADSHHTTNSMVLDPGGATYLSDGVFHRTQVETYNGPARNEDACIWRYEPITGKFERYAPYGFANPHGRVFDYWGNDLITDATGNNTYFGPAISGHIDYPAKHSSVKQFWERPSRPCPGTNIMTTKQFPEEFWGNFLNCNVIGFQGIYRVKVTEEGSGLTGTTIPEELVSSTDPNFRPVQVDVGPDGAIYFADWSNDIIGHLQHHLRDPNRDHVHGRIYRMVYEGRPLEKPWKIDGQPIPALLDLLKSPEDHIRTLAKIELGKHDSAEVIAAANKWVAGLDKSDPAYEHEVTEALWVHQWHNVVDIGLLKRVLRSPDPHARAAATRVLCYWRDRVPEALALLKVQAGDENPRVRLEAVRAASFFNEPAAVDAALASLKFPTDYYLDYVLHETMRQLDPIWHKALADGTPIASDNPAGVEYLVKSLGSNDLRKLPHTPGVLVTILSRSDVPDADRQQTLAELAKMQKTDTVTALLNGMDAVKVDSVRSAALAHLLPMQAYDDLGNSRKRLEELATQSGTPEVRSAAWAGIATADNTIAKVWAEGTKTPSSLTDVLNAIPRIFKHDIRNEAYGKVKVLLAPELPADITAATSGATATKGRYVRIELPKKGTLSLAEVQVFSGGKNIALKGRAKQSSTYDGGEASRAIDGNTEGAFSAGGMSHTRENDKNPWWEVDLGAEHPIDSVVIWNRTEDDDKYASRLDGFRLLVLDDKRNEVFKSENNPAPPESVKIAISNDAVGTLRQAAIAAAVSMDSDQKGVFDALVNLIEKGEFVPAAAHGLRSLPRSAQTPEKAAAAAKALVAWAKGVPASDRTDIEYVETVQVADTLAGALPAQQASALREELKSLRVAVYVVNTLREQMKYDTVRLVVEAGKPFEVIFQNGDFMPHNFVIVKPGTRPEVGAASATMRPDQFDSQGRAFIPRTSNIIAATKLVEPGQREALKLTAPAKEGDYEYLCTYPGHWESMWGQLVVTKNVDAYLEAHPDAQLPKTMPAKAP